MTTREHEQTLNVRLSDELRARGLDAKSEVPHPGNRHRPWPPVSRFHGNATHWQVQFDLEAIARDIGPACWTTRLRFARIIMSAGTHDRGKSAP